MRKKIEHRELKAETNSDFIRLIFLGGIEEVGRNMMVLEYCKGPNEPGDILVIDMGLRFPDEEEMMGIDFVIPNVEYLEKRKDRIRGVFITHGHYDHLGAIPYVLEKIGSPVIYTAPLSSAIILKRQDDFPNAPKPDIEIIKTNENKTINCGIFDVTPFHMNHNIPDSIGLFIKTPVGSVILTSDFKFDLHPVSDKPVDLSRIVKLAASGVLLLMSDSTGAETPGHSISEKVIFENLDTIFSKTKGRIIAATFASLISRIQQIIWLAEKYDRKVVIDGYSMKTNLEITRNLGYIKAKKGTLISAKEAKRLPSGKLVIMCTGSQGEDKAVLMRIANKEHKFFEIEKGDLVIFSSSIVPGSERSVQALKDSLLRQGAELYHYKMMDIHASGHAYQEDLKLLISLARPKFFVPVHGEYSMLKAHTELAKDVGVAEENILIPQNGRVIKLERNRIINTDESVPANYIMIDGLGNDDVGEVVLRDREALAKDGIFVVIVAIEGQTSKLRGSPDIISRGFVYLKESQELLQEARKMVKEIVSKTATKERTKNWSYVKSSLRDKIGEFLFQKTQKRPMVLPVVIEV